MEAIQSFFVLPAAMGVPFSATRIHPFTGFCTDTRIGRPNLSFPLQDVQGQFLPQSLGYESFFATVFLVRLIVAWWTKTYSQCQFLHSVRIQTNECRLANRQTCLCATTYGRGGSRVASLLLGVFGEGFFGKSRNESVLSSKPALVVAII